MPHRFPSRTLATGAALLLIGATSLTTGAEPAAASGPVRVMQFNICGAICNHGVVDKAGAGNDVVEDVRSRIVGFRPAIVT
jgi:fructose-specific phosphotransferase system IIC component